MAGAELVDLDPQNQGAPFASTGIALGGLGHGLVPIVKDVYAFSAYAEDGRVGVVQRAASGWMELGAVGATRALGLAVDDVEVFYRAQTSDGQDDIVGAFRWPSGSARVVARSPALSRQMVAVDDASVYFDGGTGVGGETALYRCPKDRSEQDARDCTRLEGPFAMPSIGGMASARLEAGMPRERYLVCYTVDTTLRCRVTRTGGS